MTCSSTSLVFSAGHERVLFFQDRLTGLVGIVAIHSTVIGPSLGGCRLKEYDSVEQALIDVLRLSEAMTYKNALCGINFGGGKAVIIAPPQGDASTRAALFKSFGREIQGLSGQYITAEDMGTSVADMNDILSETPFVAGKPPERGGGGDPSPYTARGIVAGMRGACEKTFGSRDLSGRKVAIQGLGAVGSHLARLLIEEGASLLVADNHAGRVERLLTEVGGAGQLHSVEPSEILYQECDILAPCAIGGVISEQIIPLLKCKIIAGAANNQLEREETEGLLLQRGITYVPDFVINAGGVILCADEFEEGGFQNGRVLSRVDSIGDTVRTVLEEAARQGRLAGAVAKSLAVERINSVKSR